MANCAPYELPPVAEDEEQQQDQCGDQELQTDYDTKSSSRPSLASLSSTSSFRSAGLVQKNLEAAAKLRQMSEHKEQHRKSLREKLPPLDELKVKRYIRKCCIIDLSFWAPEFRSILGYPAEVGALFTTVSSIRVSRVRVTQLTLTVTVRVSRVSVSVNG